VTRFLQPILGLLLGAGFGVIVGFITFAIMEKFNPSTLVILAPSGPLGGGILGGLLIGLVGGVVGLITGALGLRTFYGAGVGVLIFALLEVRRAYNERRFSLNGVEVSLLFDLTLIGALVSLSLPIAIELVASSRSTP
jgi:hypothetical protein